MRGLEGEKVLVDRTGVTKEHPRPAIIPSQYSSAIQPHATLIPRQVLQHILPFQN